MLSKVEFDLSQIFKNVSHAFVTPDGGESKCVVTIPDIFDYSFQPLPDASGRNGLIFAPIQVEATNRENAFALLDNVIYDRNKLSRVGDFVGRFLYQYLPPDGKRHKFDFKKIYEQVSGKNPGHDHENAELANLAYVQANIANRTVKFHGMEYHTHVHAGVPELARP